MKVVVFGAGGRTGRQVIAEAVERGHQVVAAARHIAAEHGSRRVRWQACDVLDPAQVAEAMRGADAAIVAIGPTGPDDDRTCSAGTRHVMAAARDAGVHRVACVTGAMIGHPPSRLGAILRAIRRAFRRGHPGAASDRLAQEIAVRTGVVGWTLVRPTRLVDGDPTDAIVSADARIPSLAVSRRADVARALLDAIETPAGKAGVTVVSRPPLDAAWLVRWALVFALAEVIGLGVAGGGLFAAHQAGAGPLAALGLAVIAGAIEGSIVGGSLGLVLTAARPEVRLRAWIRGTVIGAVIAWCMGMAVPLIAHPERHAGAAPPPLFQKLMFAAALGAGAGMVLAAFQWRALRPLGVSMQRWLAGNAVGWALAMPLAFVAAGRPWTSAAVVARGGLLIALMGAVVGVITGLTLRVSERRRVAPMPRVSAMAHCVQDRGS